MYKLFTYMISGGLSVEMTEGLNNKLCKRFGANYVIFLSRHFNNLSVCYVDAIRPGI